MSEATIKPPTITAVRLRALSTINAGTVPGEAMRDAAEEIDRLNACISETVKWIPVSERLPTSGTFVLIAVGKGQALAASYGNTGKGRDEFQFCGSIYQPSHWMPFPEAPK